MNVEIGAEAALFPEKEYINGIAVAVYQPLQQFLLRYFLVVHKPLFLNQAVFGVFIKIHRIGKAWFRPAHR